MLRLTAGVRNHKFVYFVYLFCLLFLYVFVSFPCITSKAPVPFCFRLALFLLAGLFVPTIDPLFLGPEDEKANVLISHIFRCTKVENFSSTVHVHEHGLKSTSVRLAYLAEDIAQSNIIKLFLITMLKNNDTIPSFFTYVQYALLFWLSGQK